MKRIMLWHELPSTMEVARYISLERLIEALQQIWFVRKHLNKTNPPPSHPLSELGLPEQQPAKALSSRQNW